MPTVCNFECPDGRCFPYRSGYKCPGDRCPMYEDFVCDNQIRCYNDYDRCDGKDECHDGTDERGCIDPSDSDMTTVAVTVITVIVFVFLIVVSVIVIVVRRRRMQSSFSNTNVINLQPHATSANTALNVSLPQASYYAPVQGWSPAHPGSYQPVFHSQHPEPPPYEEAKNYPKT